MATSLAVSLTGQCLVDAVADVLQTHVDRYTSHVIFSHALFTPCDSVHTHHMAQDEPLNVSVQRALMSSSYHPW